MVYSHHISEQLIGQIDTLCNNEDTPQQPQGLDIFV